MALFSRFANLFRQSRMDREIDSEIEAHIEMRVEDNLARGMSAAEARRDALVRFGNRAITRERVAAVDAALKLNGFGRNLRYALRQLRRSPGYALTAILALALGIGPNVAIFSIIWATFLAPLPYPHGNELVVMWKMYKGQRIPTDINDYAYFKARVTSFKQYDFTSWRKLYLTSSDASQVEIPGFPVTPLSYTEGLGERFELGRDFRPDEGRPGTDHVLIMTDRLWHERYYADPHIIGKFVEVDHEPYQVVGILAPSPNDRGETEFMVPVVPLTDARNNSEQGDYGIVFGRLKPGATIAQAQAELKLINTQLLRDRGWGNDAGAVTEQVEAFKNDWLDRNLQRSLWLLLGSVGLVLMIACTNVANLQLARATSRRQEIAARVALGATRGQIFAQLLTESILLAAIGGAAGVAIGWALMKVAVALVPELPLEVEIGLNAYVLGFAVLITMLAAVVSGCAPGWRASRVNLSEMLKQGARSVGGKSRTIMQSVLAAAEFALAMVLLAAAGMALHSFWSVTHVDLGFKTDHVVTGNMGPLNQPKKGQLPTLAPEEVIARQRELLRRLSTIPGVTHAAVETNSPLGGGFGQLPFAVDGQPTPADHRLLTSSLQIVSPDYFKAFGMRLVRGRFLNESDTASGPYVVVVNETFAKRYLANLDPLRQRMHLPSLRPGPNGKLAMLDYQIVGVVHDLVTGDKLADPPQPELWESMWQSPMDYVGFAVRTSIKPEVLMGSIRKAVVDSGYKPNKLTTMEQTVDKMRSGDRFETALLGGFATLALLLAAVGIYGLMTFAVTQRRHEIGVRMALGARRGDVVALVVRSGMKLAVIGTAIGLAGALTLGRLMQATQYRGRALDLASLSTVAILLLGVAVLACWIPARRSAGIDPIRVLRQE